MLWAPLQRLMFVFKASRSLLLRLVVVQGSMATCNGFAQIAHFQERPNNWLEPLSFSPQCKLKLRKDMIPRYHKLLQYTEYTLNTLDSKLFKIIQAPLMLLPSGIATGRSEREHGRATAAGTSDWHFTSLYAYVRSSIVNTRDNHNWLHDGHLWAREILSALRLLLLQKDVRSGPDQQCYKMLKAQGETFGDCIGYSIIIY
jgi:hypothetical protein